MKSRTGARHVLLAVVLLCSLSGWTATPQVSGGQSHTLALDTEGRIFAWGSNSLGQLGQGTVLIYPSPVVISGLPPVSQVSSRFQHVAALANDGTVWTWGLYALGSRDEPSPAKPGRVRGLDSVARIHTGFSSTLAVRSNGEAFHWGFESNNPVRVAAFDAMASVDVGNGEIVGARMDGTVIQRGGPDHGQFGTPPDPTRSFDAVSTVAGLPPMAKVYAFSGYQWAGIDRNGAVWTWGCWGFASCPGDGSGSARTATGLPAGVPVTQLSLYYSQVLARLADGTVWTAQLSTNTTASFTRLLDMQAARIGSFGDTIYVLRSDDTLWALGNDNTYGQLGNGTTNTNPGSSTTGQRVGTITGIVSVAAGQFVGYAVAANGTVYGWGSDYNGSLSGRSRFAETLPLTVALPAGAAATSRVAAGKRSSFAMTVAGQLYGWGENFGSGLGLTDRVDRSTPVLLPISGVLDIAAAQSAIVARTDGTVWETDYSAGFSQVPGLANIVRVFMRRDYGSSFALNASGVLYGFGRDQFDTGVFGEHIASFPPRAPAPVTGLPAGVADFAIMSSHAVAAMSDGTVWTWGRNEYGQLGDRTYDSRAQPRQVSGLTDIVKVAAGWCHSLALSANGTVWSWGCNYSGELGRGGTGTTTNFPVLVPMLDSIVEISAGLSGSYARRTGGLIFTWGNSIATDLVGSPLGDGTLVPRSSPVLVSRENGLGNAGAETWFLDLEPGVANNRPAFANRSMTVRTIATTDPSAQSVAAAPIPRLADVGQSVETFIFARVPANFLSLVGAPPQAGSAAAKILSAAAPKSSLVLVQLTASGWSVVTGQIGAFSSGVTSGANAASNILQNFNTTLIPGSRFCIGYGTNLQSMLANATVADVLALPGASAAGEALPCLASGTYLGGPATSISPQPVTFTATVLGVSPQGTVSLREGASVLASGAVAGGQAGGSTALTVAALAPGTHSLVAAYSGDATNAASTSDALNHLRRLQASVAVTGPSSAVQGNLTFTITVSGASPTGQVQLVVDGSPTGFAAGVTSSPAQVVTSLGIGTHQVTATYTGDSVNLAAVSAPLQVTIEAADSVPNAFSFPTVSGVTRGATAVSAAVAITGINVAAPISVSNGAYSIGCSASFTTASATIANGQTVCVRHTASTTPGGTMTTRLVVGGVAADFTSTADASVDGPVQSLPPALDFGGQSMNTTAPAQSLTFTNSASNAVTLTAITPPAGYQLAHDCPASLAAGAQCRGTVTFTPGSAGIVAGDLVIDTSLGRNRVPLAGLGERSLATHYYRSILRRAPDDGGKAYWDGEAARVARLGLDPNEAWYAMTLSFFGGAEYASFGRDDAGFVTDLYRTFFNRAPDGAGLAYWIGQVAAGMPREIVLASFMFSSEFAAFTRAIFGEAVVRAEINTVVDYYRGLLARLPDSSGFNYWLGEFQAAQCAGAGEVYRQVEAISSAYIGGAEYTARARTDALYVADLYNAFLRRGGDLDGVRYWITEIEQKKRTRDNVRTQFISSPEFSARVAAVIALGCVR